MIWKYRDKKHYLNLNSEGKIECRDPDQEDTT